MRASVVFLMGLLVGSAIAPGFAQSDRLPGENYVNHVAIAVPDFDAAFAFYKQKMGFREAFTVRDAQGQATLTFWTVRHNTPELAATMRKILDEFEKENPDIKVKLQSNPYGGLQNKVLIALRSGIPPDVIEVQTSWSWASCRRR